MFRILQSKPPKNEVQLRTANWNITVLRTKEGLDMSPWRSPANFLIYKALMFNTNFIKKYNLFKTVQFICTINHNFQNSTVKFKFLASTYVQGLEFDPPAQGKIPWITSPRTCAIITSRSIVWSLPRLDLNIWAQAILLTRPPDVLGLQVRISALNFLNVWRHFKILFNKIKNTTLR